MASGRVPPTAGFFETAWSFGKAAPQRVSKTSRFLQIQGITYLFVGKYRSSSSLSLLPRARYFALPMSELQRFILALHRTT